MEIGRILPFISNRNLPPFWNRGKKKSDNQSDNNIIILLLISSLLFITNMIACM